MLSLVGEGLDAGEAHVGILVTQGIGEGGDGLASGGADGDEALRGRASDEGIVIGETLEERADGAILSRGRG